MRIRAAQRTADLDWLAGWYPDLEPDAVPGEVEKLNDILRRLAGEGVGALADADREIAWADADFGDPLHYTEGGRRKLVEYLAPRVMAAVRPGLKSRATDGSPSGTAKTEHGFLTPQGDTLGSPGFQSRARGPGRVTAAAVPPAARPLADPARSPCPYPDPSPRRPAAASAGTG